MNSPLVIAWNSLRRWTNKPIVQIQGIICLQMLAKLMIKGNSSIF